ARINDKYEILSGLSEGDRVIVQGNSGLIDGAEVEVVQ
ncbi:MAG: efflux transporter periplasmic adaptor subunit, partial [Bacteroidia bacterium]|nr:efflux transporter periplasmic adaptor subunit [Bacteroidia bacterium]